MTLTKPIRVTFTGADPSCSVDALIGLLEEAPGLELAFLYSETRQGSGRYPPAAWIRETVETIEQCIGPGRIALHVCGRARFRFLDSGEVDLGLGNLDAFARIQLNGKLTREHADAVETMLREHPERRLIVQYEHSADLRTALPPFGSALEVLFDASGGRGIPRTSWPAPLAGHLCGYAGGLGADNLARELPRIMLAAGGAPYWIDMEGKLRDAQDRFQVQQARAVLRVLARADTRQELPECSAGAGDRRSASHGRLLPPGAGDRDPGRGAAEGARGA
jgi:hypothetical protein